MSDQAPLSVIDPPFYVELMGRAALMLKSRRDLLRVVDGDRRRFAERTPGAASLVSIPGGKENSK